MRLIVPLAAVLCVFPSAAVAQAQAPDESVAGTGGAEAGIAPVPPRGPLRATSFVLSPDAVVSGETVQVAFRVDGGRSLRVRVRVVLVKAGHSKPAATLSVGWQRPGEVVTRPWTPSLPAGSYVARLHAVTPEGRTLRRTATASGKLPVRVKVAPPPVVPVSDGVFPVGGPGWSMGGDDAGFGAQRNGHIHQGQDITAPRGTPVLSPRAGVVYWRKVQDGGAGHYLVVRGDDGRDYVFMHLVAGSETVAKGDPVTAGMQIGQVGSTGASSGPHLHFEIWPDGWYSKGSEPIDPRPELDVWAARQ